MFRTEAEPPAAVSPPAPSVRDVVACAEEAAQLMKTLGHEGRLQILCHLIGGEKSVTELEALLETRQAAVSQQLARLRLEGLVQARREGQAIFYSILDPKAAEIVTLLNRLYRRPDEEG
ncbi:ArsR/SmtB family transcription factor [Albimonas pacifica]